MKRLLLILFPLLFPFSSLSAQGGDRTLMESVQFRDSSYYNPVHAGFGIRAARAVKNQFVGDCYFLPDCPAFFHESVRKYGFFRSLVFMSDRILRCNRIGMAGHYFIGEDRKIHESPDAYMPERKHGK